MLKNLGWFMNEVEALLVMVMDLFAKKFGKHAVLRGGMVLRILGCERMTNDLDYVFVPFKSKNDLVEEILGALREIDGCEISYSLNSKCLRVVLKNGNVLVQIEAKAALNAVVSVVSTSSLSKTYGYPPRLVSVVDFPVALADKMAAWNERRLIRDIYDIWFYLKMGVRPDFSTLHDRLARPNYSRNVKKSDRFASNAVSEFFVFLSDKVNSLDDTDVKEELADYLPENEFRGLAARFKAEIAKLR
jgi:predicted nucleotidyltransferase component of viral defense system